MVGAPSEHARAPPHEILVGRAEFIVCGLGPTGPAPAPLHQVWLVRHLPPAVDRGVVEAKRLIWCTSPSQRRLGMCIEHRRLSHGIVITPRFQHQNFGARKRQDVGALTSGGARANDDDIIGRLGFTARNQRHKKFALRWRFSSVNSVFSFEMLLEEMDERLLRHGGVVSLKPVAGTLKGQQLCFQDSRTVHAWYYPGFSDDFSQNPCMPLSHWPGTGRPFCKARRTFKKPSAE